MIHDILVNVFNTNNDTESNNDTENNNLSGSTKDDNSGSTKDKIDKWYDTSFLYNKDNIITGTYISRDEAITKFKNDSTLNKEDQIGTNTGTQTDRKSKSLAGMDDAMEMKCKADETLMMIDGNSNAITFNKTKCSNDVYEKIHNSIINIIDGSLN